MDKKNESLMGNQHARKHGFYSNVLDEQQRLDFEQAIQAEGLDEEIALLRVKIKSLVEHDPENVKLIIQAINMLMKTIIARYDISKNDTNAILDAVGNVMKNIALPMGMTIGTLLKK